MLNPINPNSRRDILVVEKIYSLVSAFPFILMSIFLGFAAWYRRLDLENDYGAFLMLSILVIYFQIMPDVFTELIRKYRKLQWVNYGWSTFIHLLTVMILGATLGQFGLYLIVIYMLSALLLSQKWRIRFKYIQNDKVKELYLIPFIFLYLVAVASLTTFLIHYGWLSAGGMSPVFEMELKVKYFNRDLLAQSAYSTTFRDHFFPSSGMHGSSTFFPYHLGSQIFMSTISSLLNRPTIYCYNFFYLIVFYPAFLHTIYRTCLDFIARPNYWMKISTFLSIYFMFFQFVWGESNIYFNKYGLFVSYIQSQTYAFSLWLLMIYISSLFSHSSGSIRTNLLYVPKPLYFLVPLLIASIVYSKVTVGALVVLIFGINFAISFVNNPKKAPYFLAVLSSTATLLSLSLIKSSRQTPFQWNFFLHRYTKAISDPVLFYAAYYHELWIALSAFIILLFWIFATRKSHLFNEKLFSKLLFFTTVSCLIFILTLPIHHLVIEGGSGAYFTNLPMWVSILVLSLVFIYFFKTITPAKILFATLIFGGAFVFNKEIIRDENFNYWANSAPFPVNDSTKNSLEKSTYSKYLEAFEEARKHFDKDYLIYVSRRETAYWMNFNAMQRCEIAPYIPIVLAERNGLFPVTMAKDRCYEYPNEFDYWLDKNYVDIDLSNEDKELCNETIKLGRPGYISIQYNYEFSRVDILNTRC